MSDQRIPISQLSETQTAPDASYIAIDDGSLTKKITVENFNSTSTASAQQYANQAAASAQTVEDNIATSAAQIREATLAAREATQASTSATASATSAYDSASLAQNYSANASTSAGQAMNAADSAAQNLTASKGYAEDSEAWAVGKRNGSDVSTSDETYQNNAKYYADNASGSATRAEAAAQSITAPDTTLTRSGVAADSKVVGDRISSVNAELVDIRVKADGTTATTAGGAIREQVSELKNDLALVYNFSKFADSTDYIPVYVKYEQGRYNQSGEKDNVNKANRCRSAEILDSADYDVIIVNHESKAYGVYISYYDANKAFVAQTNMKARTEDQYVIEKYYAYFSITCIDYTGASYNNPITPQECTNNFYVCKYNAEKEWAYSADAVVAKWGYAPVKTVYENGRLDETGAETDAPYITRVRTDFFATSEADYVVNSRAKDYVHYIFYYDSNKVFQTSTPGQQTTSTAIDKSYAYFRLVVLNYDNNSFNNPITPIEAANNVMCAKSSALSRTITDTTHLSSLDLQKAYPTYFASQLRSARTAITNHMGIVGKNGCTFAFVTDIHWTSNEKHTPALLVWLRNVLFLNKIVLGGDYINQHAQKETAITTMQWCLSYFRNLSEYVFPIFGNHDRNSNGTTSDVYMTDEEAYAIVNQWVNNEVVYGSNYFDYYWDDEKCNTRYVMIDTGAQSIDGGVIAEETFTWLDTALNTDKNIVVIAHWLFSPTTWNKPLVDGVLTGSYTASATRLFDVLDAKNQNGGKVQAIITGHVHCDYDAKTSGGIPIIWTDTDSRLAFGAYTATVGTVSEQCFDIITIDYASKVIYCDRIGRGISREISY